MRDEFLQLFRLFPIVHNHLASNDDFIDRFSIYIVWSEIYDEPKIALSAPYLFYQSLLLLAIFSKYSNNRSAFLNGLSEWVTFPPESAVEWV